LPRRRRRRVRQPPDNSAMADDLVISRFLPDTGSRLNAWSARTAGV
jgi:hypothetical protein